jgi:copper(I)-binding protein
MLMDLKQPLPKGGTVPLTLRFQDAKGVESRLELSVPVSAVAPSAAATPANTPAPAHDQAGQHGAHKH